MKFLATIRFDPTDDYVFEQAAAPDEWAVPGGFTFAHLPPEAMAGKTGQAFANGFVSLESHGHSTFASVVEISQTALDALTGDLADHLVDACGAPDRAAALKAAKVELEFVVDLCRDVNLNTVFSLRRSHNEAGEIHEEFRTITPAQASGHPGAHARVWEIVEDDPAPETGIGR